MKKIIAILFVLCTVAGTANAQHFGIRAGVNVLDMSINNKVLAKDNRAGFYVGPTVKFTLPIVGLGIDASALYDQRTGKVEFESANTAGEYQSENVTSRSIAIPVNVRYGVGLGELINVFAFAGPQVAFNLSGDKYFGAAEWSWKKSQFSVNLGLGVTVLKKFEVKANYNVACGTTGEASLKKAASAAGKSLVKSKYNSWQIGAAYYF